MCEQMAGRFLTDFEFMIMLAVLRLRDDAYGVTIAREIEQTTGRGVTLAAVYLALERLQHQRLVASTLGEATPERGGRAKKYFRVTPDGLRAVRNTQRAFAALAKGIPELKGAAI
jgi:DNA-binding PadR family transcriptional regulator